MTLVTLILACSVYADPSIVKAMVALGLPKASSITEQTVITEEKQKQPQNEDMIGLMQVSRYWLQASPFMHVTPTQLVRPCKNIVVATQLLNWAQIECEGSLSCALAFYKTGDKTSDVGLAYAERVMSYAQQHPFVPPVLSHE